jgi:hypothetical protein
MDGRFFEDIIHKAVRFSDALFPKCVSRHFWGDQVHRFIKIRDDLFPACFPQQYGFDHSSIQMPMDDQKIGLLTNLLCLWRIFDKVIKINQVRRMVPGSLDRLGDILTADLDPILVVWVLRANISNDQTCAPTFLVKMCFALVILEDFNQEFTLLTFFALIKSCTACSQCSPTREASRLFAAIRPA